MNIDTRSLAAMIDHTELRATAQECDIDNLCHEAMEHGFATVCVNGKWVAHAKAALTGSPVGVCTVVGFPLGASATKAEETTRAVADGADEVDMVIDIAAANAGQWDEVEAEIAAVVKAANGKPVKVILETCYLSDEAKTRACAAAKAAGATWVKTSTGMGPAGANTHDVALMAACGLPVKASGGVRTRSDAEAMVKAGATRLGTSNGVGIVTGTAGTSQY